MTDIDWPRYDHPDDLPVVEATPLSARGLPGTSYDLLRRAAAHWPERTALTVLPDAQSWRSPRIRGHAALLADVHQVANALHRLGVRRDDSVALLSPNCDELVTALLGAQLAGIATPINPALARDHVAELIRRSGARILITASPELDGAAFETGAQLARDGLVDHVLVLRPTGAESDAAADVTYLADLAADSPHDRFLGVLPTATDLAAFFHTGGTTGAPKLAAHTHANEISDAWMIAANSVLDEESVVFAALPLFHVNALVVTLLAPLFRGQQVVWAGPLGYRDVPLYAEFWRIVEHYRIATMSAVPTVYSVLAGCPVDGADIGSMRCAMVGASALPEGVRTSFEKATGIPLLEGYGLTEATCASVRGFLDAPRPGSAGQRLPYQRIRIGDGLPPGEIGVVHISGPTVFPGYVEGRDGDRHRISTQGKVVDGWLNTGDLGLLDEDGFLHLTGRAKDLIIRGGHNIDPRVIEDALLSHPAVTGAQAVGQPDRRAGEVPVAYVTLADATVGEGELLEWAAAHLGERAAAPKSVRVLDALPVTAVGKPYKLPLRADATRRVLAEALAGLAEVEVDADSGTVTATVTPHSEANLAEVERRVGEFAVRRRIVAGRQGDH
ncbi:AMP-binding domain protein [Streptomyces davaonensis JCM 4913]|uniref:AMP-binding domain protein n=1 Tax=Streptomyces davaonensis (strain DSM 101723 / JCM 4913 / KCC S-0913 / 768) TaxID=1214101 RepID=K4RFD4_STRDJ|nr:acyl-CoA synthetase [Streptomyces davaonensis]CCK32588.1 AMP-binding domain protein [Streptomyces davaonensis JCM 4913]